MLTAFWQEARGLQVIECPAARTFDLQFKAAADRGKLAVAVTASDVLHGCQTFQRLRLKNKRHITRSAQIW